MRSSDGPAPALIATVALIGTLALVAPARADDEAAPAHLPVHAAPATSVDMPPDAETGFWERSALLGDIGGLRQVLGNLGLTFEMEDVSEVFANVKGGLRQGTAYDGQLVMGLSLDTAKAFGWEGGTVYINALQLHGHAPTPAMVGSLHAVSNIEADPSTRLYDAYFEQELGIVNIRAGQFGVDEEFMLSQFLPPGSGADDADYADAVSTFINSTFGFPGLPSLDLPGGGPGFPLAVPGVRLRVRPTPAFGFQAAVFQGNPGGPGDDPADPQKRNPSGFSAMQLCCGVLGIVEADYTVNGGKQHAGMASSYGLVGTYKVGAWIHTASFDDQRYNAVGALLADPPIAAPGRSSAGPTGASMPAPTRWCTKPATKRGRGSACSAASWPRRTIAIWSASTSTAASPGTVRSPAATTMRSGLGFAYAGIGARARRYDTDVNYYSGPGLPQRDFEGVLEATYQIQLAGWWQLQPDFQYIIHPGGGAGSPNAPTQRLPNAGPLGLRTLIVF